MSLRVAAVSTFSLAFVAPTQDAKLEVQPIEIASASGAMLRAERGRLSVPENRRNPESREITLAFVRILSMAESAGAPIVFLHGGPGGVATPIASDPGAVALWETFLDLGDVILLDQRGCGASEPNLGRAPKSPPPPDIFSSRKALEAYFVAEGTRVRDELVAEGIDSTGYDTEQSADDVDDLRKALGVGKLRLFGFSYGTHLGLSVLKRHGARVESAVLIGVEGLDETEKLPSVYDVHLKRLSALIARDPVVGTDVPDFDGLVRRVMKKLAAAPMMVEVTQPMNGVSVSVPVGADGLAYILLRDLGDASDLPVFPRLLASIDRGDPSVLRWFVQKRYGEMRYPTLVFTCDAASGCTPDRAARIAAEVPRCALGAAMNFDMPRVAKLWSVPDLGEEFRAPFACKVRTLFLSGTLDVNTPPHQAERVRWGFTDSVHLVQANGGHDSWMENPAVPDAIHDFFAGEDVSHRDVDLPPLAFVPLEGSRRGASHPSVR